MWCPRSISDTTFRDHLTYTPPLEACEGLGLSDDPIGEDFGCEPARLPVLSPAPGTPARRMPASAELSLGGCSLAAGSLVERPTGLAEPAGRLEPEMATDWAPYVLMAGSPCSGWERPSSLALGPKREPVRWA